MLILSCSRKKDKWVNRIWHDITTKNNTLFNGRNAFAAGQADIVQTYRDHFWEILPVERMITIEDVRLPNEVLNTNFDRAEQKAIKAIQRHSMLINDRERNPKMDDAFLLLGKARYFEQRFIPALEAFNYILYKYPSSNTINHAKVWRAKTNLRLDNNEKAITDLKRMIRLEYLDDTDYADAHAMIAQAYINLKVRDSALLYIDKAALFTRNNEEKGRFYFIKGQLCNALGKKDSANIAFDAVIALNRKTPRRYRIQAQMAKARNFDYQKGDRIAFLEHLTEMEENRENRPFLDIIFHEKAQYFKKTDSIAAATVYYNKSLRTQSKDTYLESLNYLNLGNFKFDAKAYAVAGSYYDSTLTKMIVDTKRYRVLKKKRDNLKDVIYYEKISRSNDSILLVTAMGDAEKLSFYKAYTDSLQAKAIDNAKAQKDKLRQNNAQAQFPLSVSEKKSGTQTNSASGRFYFYNSATVAFGKVAFKRTFGNRELQDYWKIASLSNSKIGAVVLAESKQEQSPLEDDPRFDPQTYIDRLPTDSKILDSLARDRNYADYQLGVVYKEKFLEYELSKAKFQAVLRREPEERLVIPSKYNLYKIHQKQENYAEANRYKNDIIQNHGNSKYAKILKNPTQQLLENQEGPSALYTKLYTAFQNQKFAHVLTQSERLIEKYGSDAVFLPKFEFLKAQTIGRYQGLEPYKKALQYVALHYPQSPEGKKAEQIIQNTFPQLQNQEFTNNHEVKNHKLLFIFAEQEKEEAEKLQLLLAAILEELRYDDKMKISIDAYSADRFFVTVHCKRDLLGAQGLSELLALGKIENTKEADLSKWNRKKIFFEKIERNSIEISSQNYRIMQIHKSLDRYLEFRKRLDAQVN